MVTEDLSDVAGLALRQRGRDGEGEAEVMADAHVKRQRSGCEK